MDTTYTDLEIRIRSRLTNGYPVELSSCSSGQEFPGGLLGADEPPPLNQAEPHKTGEELFQWLFADTHLRDAWNLARGRYPLRRIRLRIDAEAPELHLLPWELLRDPGNDGVATDITAAAATPFSRYLAGEWLPGRPVLDRPIRILVAIADPKDLAAKGWPALDAEREWKDISDLEACHPDLIRTERLKGCCTLEALTAALGKGGFHILHFIGHGFCRQVMGEDEKLRAEASLCLANDDNCLETVPDTRIAEALARLLRDPAIPEEARLRLIYLSSCETAVRDPFDAFLGLAPKLVASGVPAVMAMQQGVPADTAVAFSRAFYAALLDHGQIDRATNTARATLLTANDPAAFIPVLFQRLRDGQLFGKPGVLLGDVTDTTWDSLLWRISTGLCTPILGPGVAAGLLPSGRDLARALAGQTYPFDEKDDLRRVTQFYGRVDDAGMRGRVLEQLRAAVQRNLRLAGNESRLKSLSSLSLDQWTAISQTFETQIHTQLAELDLPLYVTTGFDNFMALALERRLQERARLPAEEGATGPPDKPGTVHREVVRWTADKEQRLIPNFEPLESAPVVLHLFGNDEDPSTMVLTEDDHLDYLAQVSHDQQLFLPSCVNALLAENTLLFLGYNLEDLDLKVILRGVLKNLAHKNRMNLAVQVEGARPDDSTQKGIIEYFEKSLTPYFSTRSTVKIFWGSAQSFVTELIRQKQKAARANG